MQTSHHKLVKYKLVLTWTASHLTWAYNQTCVVSCNDRLNVKAQMYVEGLNVDQISWLKAKHFLNNSFLHIFYCPIILCDLTGRLKKARYSHCSFYRKESSEKFTREHTNPLSMKSKIFRLSDCATSISINIPSPYKIQNFFLAKVGRV